MLIDEAVINVRGGSGGNGAASFRRNAQTAKGGPDGGNGGNGGNVYLKGIDDVTALAQFRYKKKFSAEDGIKGGKQNLYGRNGKDLIISIPIGTQVTDKVTKDSFEVANSQDKILVARGGKGGRGNNEFKSATNQTPLYAEKGEMGESRQFILELKLIADVGLIGFPNSGKSSLLSVLTNANPKIGNYPFTTLEPNLGVLGGLIIADIPGLIEGASGGKGLGIKFLKHVEKTKVLVHCIDIQSESLSKDYQTIRSELKAYNESLINKPEIILITKADLVDEKTREARLRLIKKLNNNSFLISIYSNEQLSNFKKVILDMLHEDHA